MKETKKKTKNKSNNHTYLLYKYYLWVYEPFQSIQGANCCRTTTTTSHCQQNESVTIINTDVRTIFQYQEVFLGISKRLLYSNFWAIFQWSLDAIQFYSERCKTVEIIHRRTPFVAIKLLSSKTSPRGL